ncbi:Ubiquitin carboxyl-terminal hydrolase isozyme L3 [Balamuthia mandrillaris]
MDAQQEAKFAHWIPLESNPEILTEFIHRLGVSEQWAFSDCYGFDDELLAMVPQPCIGLLFLFPSSKMKTKKEEEAKRIAEKGQTVSDNLYFMKQLVGNQCGTVGVIHAVLNALGQISLKEDSPLDKFYKATKPEADPKKRGELLGRDAGIEQVHKDMATQGQTEAPDAESKIDLHFICMTHVDGHLYELDGRKAFPINHGTTTPETFLKDATALFKREWVDTNPDEVNFSILTLGPN